MQKIFLIAAAGALGTLARYGLSGLIQRIAGPHFPWGTLAVNVTGCFLFGLIWSLAEGRLGLNGETRAIVLVGFMGAFTTFSTFIFETGGFARQAQWGLTLANLAAQNLVGFIALTLGWATGRIV